MFCSCDDPMDISVFVLNLFMKYFAKKFKMAAYVARAIGGFCFIFAEGFVVIYELLKCVKQQLAIAFICAGIYVVLLVILLVIGYSAVKNDDYKRVRIFFLVFKIMNFVMALIIGGGTLYGKGQLNFSYWLHIALIVCIGLDVVIDPIEIIMFCCWWCGGK